MEVRRTIPARMPMSPKGQANRPVRHLAERNRRMDITKPPSPPKSVHDLAIGLSPILISYLKSLSSYVYVKPLNDMIPNTRMVIEVQK